MVSLRETKTEACRQTETEVKAESEAKGTEVKTDTEVPAETEVKAQTVVKQQDKGRNRVRAWRRSRHNEVRDRQTNAEEHRDTTQTEKQKYADRQGDRDRNKKRVSIYANR